MTTAPKVVYTYKWTHFSGAKEKWSFWDCTARDAENAAIAQGWRPPQWWQWWRRHDQPRHFRALEQLPDD